MATWASLPGAPLGGLPNAMKMTTHGLARELIHPLAVVTAKRNLNGSLQVTAIKCGGQWHVIEYNIRIGVTFGPMILSMLKNPAEIILRTTRNEKFSLQFNEN